VIVRNSKKFGCTAEQNAVNFELFFVSKCKKEIAEQNTVLLLAIPKSLAARQNKIDYFCSLRGRTKQIFKIFAARQNKMHSV
jgi:hypothetical protein